jgi:hypothetical protein
MTVPRLWTCLIRLRYRAPLQAPDPGDQFQGDLLAVKADLLLVAGDKQLLHESALRGRVLSPQAFVNR